MRAMTTTVFVGALAAFGLPGASVAWNELPQQQVIDNVQAAPNNMLRQRRVRKRPRGNVLADRFPQVAGPMIHSPHSGPVTAAAITTAIESAVLFLGSRQGPYGSIGRGYAEGGSTALAALAMLAAGVDPNSDKVLRAALDYLVVGEFENTYVRGIRANVWEYALRKAPDEKRFRDALDADVKWLLEARNETGWRYNKSSTDWDNSCTQYAALGLWAAQRAGIETGDEVWDQLARHFRKTQNSDGGWGYVQSSSSTPNMATAGLATLYLVFDHHYGRRHAWRRGQPAPFDSGEARQVLDAIDRGLTWLATADGDKSNAYYLYGIERTGVAGGRRMLGGSDWFAEGADATLRAQRTDGAIPLGYSDEIGTALSTLFLVYGGAPPAFAKLRHGEGDDWNLNPRDLANLTRRLWQAYERPLNWHVVSIDDPIEAFETPILFVSGSKAATFDDAQVARLRTYVERGGTIVAEAADGSPAFRASMVDLHQRLFPPAEHPGMALHAIDESHAIYGIVSHQWKARPRLTVASDGVRPVFVVSEDYLAAKWQTDDVESDAFPLAMNLLFHTTALAPLEGRFAADPLPGEAMPLRDDAVIIARAMHGTGRDWDAAAHAWDRVRPFVRHTTGLRIENRGGVALDPTLAGSDVQVLHITGRRAIALSVIESAALRAFVERGGTVLVDAFGGADAFAASARAAIETAIGPLEPLERDATMVNGLFDGGVDLARRVRYDLAGRRALRAAGAPVDGLDLLTARHNGRPAVIFSRFDLSAGLAGVAVHGRPGFAPETARHIVSNLLAWRASTPPLAAR